MKKLMVFLIPVDKNNSILFSHCINLITYTVCTVNPIFQKERLRKRLKQTHVRNTEKNSQNNIA